MGRAPHSRAVPNCNPLDLQIFGSSLKADDHRKVPEGSGDLFIARVHWKPWSTFGMRKIPERLIR